ncbi:MAG: XdhC family protein [Actinobacteria bacterium]|nr:XdhC family protein [Actinomycetota bacterium]
MTTRTCAERARLVEAADRALAVATVVHTRGSVYRREGARLVVLPEGATVGNISGGCLEADVVAAAGRVAAGGSAELLSFDLTTDDEAVWGWGLGCNGAIEVLVEPADRARPALAAIGAAEGDGRAVALVRVLDEPEPTTRTWHVVDPDAPPAALDDAVVEACRQALEAEVAGTTWVTTSSGQHRIFVDVVLPPPRLVVCGAGHDAAPVVAAASTLGWRTIVVDDRPHLLTAARFPYADGLVAVDRPGVAAGEVHPDPRTHVIVMSHHYLRDVEYLRSFLRTDVSYLGVLGPRRRRDRMVADLAREGIALSLADELKLHGPVGLDLGAEGPVEIAWSIVTELLAWQRGRCGGSLRDRAGPIHGIAARPAALRARGER